MGQEAAIILGAWAFAAAVALSETTSNSFVWISLFIALGVTFYFGVPA